MKIYVADRETGTFIEEVKTIADGKKLIEKFEDIDRNENTFTPNFYNLVNEYHETIYF